MDILDDARGVAARAVGPFDAAAAQVVGVQVVETDGGRDDESDAAVAQQTFVHARACAYYQYICVAHVVGRDGAAGQEDGLIDERRDGSADVGDFVVDDCFHGCKVTVSERENETTGVPIFVPLRWYGRTSVLKLLYHRSGTTVPPQWN